MKNYYVLAVAVLLEAMIPFFLIFEDVYKRQLPYETYRRDEATGAYTDLSATDAGMDYLCLLYTSACNPAM